MVLRGEAVLLRSAAQVVHGHPLDVGGDLDVGGIRNQVRETCRDDTQERVWIHPAPDNDVISHDNEESQDNDLISQDNIFISRE